MTGEVSPRDPHAGEVSVGDLRASYQDRDRVAELLRVAAGDGRLTAEELDERLEAALTARTYRELAALTRDLPAAPGFAPALPDEAPKDLVRIECTSASTSRQGRWVVPQRMEVRVGSGSVTLDFTEAVISTPVLRIEAEVRSGRLLLITKPGILVDADNVSLRSGHVKVRPPGRPDRSSILRIEVVGKVGSGHITARPPRRSFWQWLLRRPHPYALP